MNLLSFSPSPISVTGDFEVNGSDFIFEFSVADTSDAWIDRPSPGHWTSWPRQDGLWNTTCFEAFWKRAQEKSYWELNLSPSKKSWNLYHFSDYRQPQPPAPSNDFQLREVTMTHTTLRAVVRNQIALSGISASLCAIVSTAQEKHFFALQHASVKPDFHWPQSFILNR